MHKYVEIRKYLVKLDSLNYHEKFIQVIQCICPVTILLQYEPFTLLDFLTLGTNGIRQHSLLQKKFCKRH